MNSLLRGLDRHWFEPAPARRPAVLRVLVGAYTLYYVGKRYRMYIKVAGSDGELFEPVGVVSNLKKPVPVGVFRAVLVATLLANVAFVLGVWHRWTGPLFAGLLLWVLSYRNSWSMIYHNDNALVLHVLTLGLSRSADALSVDALAGATEGAEGPDWRYGWPVRLMSTVTAITYFVAGVAKVAGPLGWRWAGGDAMRAQVMADGIRKELLGGQAAPLAYALRNKRLLFGLMGFGSLVLELCAPLALADKRLSRLWAFGAFALHWGIYGVMKITFRYQMAGLIFASFFPVERPLERSMEWLSRLTGARKG